MAVENENKDDKSEGEGSKTDPKSTASSKDGGAGSSDSNASDKERADAIVKAAREEAAKAVRERDEAVAREKALKEEKAAREAKELEEQGKFKELAENEKKNAENAKTEATKIVQEANSRVVTSEIRMALIQAGATDPDIHVMINRDTIKVENGNVSGIAEAIEKFKSEKPHFFGETKKEEKGTRTGAGGTPPKGKEGAGDTPPDVTKMKPDEYQAHRRKFLRELGVSGAALGSRTRRRG